MLSHGNEIIMSWERDLMSWERDKYFFSHVPSVLPYLPVNYPIENASAISVEFRGIRPRMYIEDLF